MSEQGEMFTRHDDLTVIKGIKDVRQHLLRTSLNINRYDDLARAAVDDILGAFRSAGQPVTAATIEGWIAEAARLAATRASQRRGEPGEAREAGYKTLALFMIEFGTEAQIALDDPSAARYQIRVHHMERDLDRVLTVLEPAPLWEAMADALDEDAPHLAQTMRHAGKLNAPAASAEAEPEARLAAILHKVQALAANAPPSPTPAAAAEPNAQRRQRFMQKYAPEAFGSATDAGVEPASPAIPQAQNADRLAHYLVRHGLDMPEARPVTAPASRETPMPPPVPPEPGAAKLERYLRKYGSL